MNLGDKYPDKSPLTAARLMDGEAVVVVPQDNEVKILNEVGSRIWELLDGRRDINRICSIISSEFVVSYDEAVEDIVEFINELCEKKMVVMLESPKDNEDIQIK
jgi:hypothetical protein